MIESPRNERIKRYRRLHKKNMRYRESLFLAEGLQAVGEAVQAQAPPECIICDRRGMGLLDAMSGTLRARSIPVFEASGEVMETLTSTVTPQGLVAVCPMLHVSLEELLLMEPSILLLADRVRDPGNLGNMIRIADAAGADGIVVCPESADPYNPKTVRSTAGSIFHLPIALCEDAASAIVRLKEEGFAVYAADARTGRIFWEVEWAPRTALVMGNEAWGVAREEREIADGLVHIPIAGRAESLNVSVAAALLLYEILRKRRGKDADGGGGKEER